MRRLLAPVALLLAFAVPAPARGPAPKLVLETWHAAYLDGIRAGHVHTTVHEISRDGAKFFRTAKSFRLRVKRYNTVVPSRFEVTSEEQADGKARALSVTFFSDKGGKLTTTGTVEGGELVVRSPREPAGRRLPWNADCLGLYKQEVYFKGRKVKPGDRFTFLTYELPIQATLTTRAVVKGREVADVLEVKTEGGKTTASRVAKKLLRVETRSDKVKLGKNVLQLPAAVAWLDDDGTQVRYQSEVPALGKLTLLRATKEVATGPGLAPELLPDVGLNSVVSVSGVIERPDETKFAVYRVKVKADDDPGTLFTRDGRQSVRNLKGNTFELVVRAEAKATKGDAPGKELLGSSHFLDSDNFLIKSWAKRLTKGEVDPGKKARRLEKWVHENMKVSHAAMLPPASEIIRQRTGDCRQCGMLLAALCRAAGIPARTAVGLIYSQGPGEKPQLVFHMWTEAWFDGRWVGLDATRGGGISACHLKVADQDWQDTQPLAPLLVLLRVIGNISVEVVEAR
jgi:hypothetical protein